MAHRLLKGEAVMMKRRRNSAGYSLTEMLVVVAIIGIMALIAVPNFIQYYRASKLKSSLRLLTNDLRNARQRAVANNSMTKLTFQTDVSGGSYTILESTDKRPITDATKVWSPYVGPKTLEKPTFLTNTNFVPIGTDTLPGVVFSNDGAVQLPAGVNPGTVDIKTSDLIPVNKYTISVYPYGKVTAN